MLDASDCDRGTIDGLARGLAVIATFSADRPRLSVADVARLATLERAMARRCLQTLTRLGHAEHDGKFFALRPRVLRPGYAFLERLSDATGESASASILDGSDIVSIARAAQKRVVSITLSACSRLPAYCASMGRVMLGALQDAEPRRILERTDRRALTPRTLTGLDKLMGEIARVAIGDPVILPQSV